MAALKSSFKKKPLGTIMENSKLNVLKKKKLGKYFAGKITLKEMVFETPRKRALA